MKNCSFHLFSSILLSLSSYGNNTTTFYSILFYSNQLLAGQTHYWISIYLYFSTIIFKNWPPAFKPSIIQNHNGVLAPGAAAVFFRPALSFQSCVSKVQNPKKQRDETRRSGTRRWHVGGGCSSIIEEATGSRWRRAPPPPPH